MTSTYPIYPQFDANWNWNWPNYPLGYEGDSELLEILSSLSATGSAQRLRIKAYGESATVLGLNAGTEQFYRKTICLAIAALWTLPSGKAIIKHAISGLDIAITPYGITGGPSRERLLIGAYSRADVDERDDALAKILGPRNAGTAYHGLLASSKVKEKTGDVDNIVCLPIEMSDWTNWTLDAGNSAVKSARDMVALFAKTQDIVISERDKLNTVMFEEFSVAQADANAAVNAGQTLSAAQQKALQEIDGIKLPIGQAPSSGQVLDLMLSTPPRVLQRINSLLTKIPQGTCSPYPLALILGHELLHIIQGYHKPSSIAIANVIASYLLRDYPNQFDEKQFGADYSKVDLAFGWQSEMVAALDRTFVDCRLNGVGRSYGAGRASATATYAGASGATIPVFQSMVKAFGIQEKWTATTVPEAELQGWTGMDSRAQLVYTIRAELFEYTATFGIPAAIASGDPVLAIGENTLRQEGGVSLRWNHFGLRAIGLYRRYAVVKDQNGDLRFVKEN